MKKTKKEEIIELQEKNPFNNKYINSLKKELGEATKNSENSGKTRQDNK